MGRGSWAAGVVFFLWLELVPGISLCSGSHPDRLKSSLPEGNGFLRGALWVAGEGGVFSWGGVRKGLVGAWAGAGAGQGGWGVW